jgi:hypothetical protein
VVELHVELSVPGPHPDVGVGGGGVVVAAGAHAGSLGFAVQSTPGAGGVAAFPVLLLSCAFAVAASIPSVRIPATKIGKIINAIGLCTISSAYKSTILYIPMTNSGIYHPLYRSYVDDVSRGDKMVIKSPSIKKRSRLRY